jgi:hypothetical protein
MCAEEKINAALVERRSSNRMTHVTARQTASLTEAAVFKKLSFDCKSAF